jgi:hypothetical protein
MKKLILFFTLILSGFFLVKIENEFIEGEKQLKKLIYSKLILILLELMKIRL